MGIPQIIILSLVALNLLLTANLHGKYRKDKHNFFATFIGSLINLSILYWGGFFG